MYEPKQVSKVTTVIGLVFEGLGLLAILAGLSVIIVLSGQGRDFFLDQDLTEGQVDMLLLALNVFTVILVVMAFLVLCFFIVNLYLFTRLVRGRFTPGQAKNVHLYQAIWGGVNILFNQIAGVLYLVSGLSALSDVDTPDDES